MTGSGFDAPSLAILCPDAFRIVYGLQLEVRSPTTVFCLGQGYSSSLSSDSGPGSASDACSGATTYDAVDPGSDAGSDAVSVSDVPQSVVSGRATSPASAVPL